MIGSARPHQCEHHSERSVGTTNEHPRLTNRDFEYNRQNIESKSLVSIGIQVGKSYYSESQKPLANRIKQMQKAGQPGSVKNWLHIKPPHSNSKDESQIKIEPFAALGKDFTVTGFRNIDSLAWTFTGKQRSFDKIEVIEESNDSKFAITREKWSLNSTKTKFEWLKQVYSLPQKSGVNSKGELQNETSKHPWLINGSKFRRMKQTEKMWER